MTVPGTVMFTATLVFGNVAFSFPAKQFKGKQH